jgi:hypothetical protein
MDNQSKRIADLVVELIGAMKVELTPTGQKVEDILGYIDDGIAPLKEDVIQNFMRVDLGFDNYTLVNDEKVADLREKMTEALDGISELESRVDDLESNADDDDITGAIEAHCGSYEFRREVQEIAVEAIDDYDFSEKVDEAVRDAIRDDSELEACIRRVVQDEIKNALQVLVAHWADN